jgi:GNAT superfamily N-acetyltransferase
LVTIEGAVVALCAYKLGGKMPDNRDVYEISNAFMMPEFQRKGLNRHLGERVLQMITDRHPGALMMSFTKTTAIIEQCMKLGWQKISIEEYSNITRRIGRSGISPEASGAFQHWEGFLFDPE